MSEMLTPPRALIRAASFETCALSDRERVAELNANGLTTEVDLVDWAVRVGWTDWADCAYSATQSTCMD